MPSDTDSLRFLGSVDVVVIGGGPAGAACALALRTYTGHSVALIESTDYGNTRLGENVSAAILPLLDYLDLKERFLKESAHIESFTVMAAWGHDLPLPQHSLRHWSGEGYLLDRGRFDTMLAESFRERGGKLYLSCRAEAIMADDDQGHLLHVRHASGKYFAIHAKFLVDASGRKAGIARRLGATSTRHGALIGVSRFFEMDATMSYSRDILIESVRDGWWYSAPLPDNRLVMTLMTDGELWRQHEKEPIGRWQDLLTLAPHSYARLQQAAIGADEELTVRDAHSHVLEESFGRDWLAVGDAAASFDPLSSLGIGFAIHSACHGARAIGSYLENRDEEGFRYYAASVKTQFAAYLPIWRSYYACESRYADAPFWQIRQNTHLLVGF